MTKYEPLNRRGSGGKDHGGLPLPLDAAVAVSAAATRSWTRMLLLLLLLRMRMRMRVQRVRILMRWVPREKVAKHKSEQRGAHNKQIIERLDGIQPTAPGRVRARRRSSRQTSQRRQGRQRRRSVIMARRKCGQCKFTFI